MDELESEVARVFMRWDIDHNGRMNRFEFQGVIDELAPERSMDASNAFDEMDLDDDKTISVEEFLTWFRE